MTDWQVALDEFLMRWKRRRKVTAALACGSFVTGNPTKHSDIDVHILLNRSTQWRERGNDIVKGFLIEYFANPPHQVRHYFAQDFSENRNMCATQFATGRILFDEEGDAMKLQREAARWLRKPFRRPDRVRILADRYNLWDQLDNFQESVEGSSVDLSFQYANCLAALVRVYARYCGDSLPSPSKLYRYLTSDELTRKYRDRPVADPEFAQRAAKAMLVSDPDGMVASLGRLTRYVHERMGGFEVDGFRLRSKADLSTVKR